MFKGMLVVLCLCGAGVAQHGGGSTASVPLPDPGYELYYHDTAGPTADVTRWAYHDGWKDGRLDRDQGKVIDLQTKPQYLSPPDHGVAGITRDRYEKTYKAAYIHGYQHGFRL